MHKANYFSIDFLKFMLVVGMMFRHAPLYLYDGMLLEYSISEITPFSVFIPITSGFIFVLGYTLALNKQKYTFEKYTKHFTTGVKLLAISVCMGGVSYYIRGLESPIFEYYLEYKWDASNKPGYYILLPISVFFIFSSIIRRFTSLNLTIISIISAIACLVMYSFYELYFLHYITFGFIGLALGSMRGSYNSIERFSAQFWVVAIGSYILIYLFFSKVNFFTELILLLGFSCLLIFTSKFIRLLKFKRFITFFSSEILLFYLIHVAILNLLSGHLLFSNWYSMTLFCLFSVVAMAPVIVVIRKFLPKTII